MIWKSALRRYLLASVVLAAGGSLFATFNGVPLEPEADEGPTVGATSLEDLRETYARWAEGYAEAEPAGPVIRPALVDEPPPKALTRPGG